jgi:hypothetical protein
MKNAVVWDIKTQFVPRRRQYDSAKISADYCYMGFEVFTAVTMKNAVFWDIKTQFVPHRRHNTFRLQNPAGKCDVGFEVFTAVTMKNVVFRGIKKQCLPHRKHYISAKVPSRLMLCKI